VNGSGSDGSGVLPDHGSRLKPFGDVVEAPLAEPRELEGWREDSMVSVGFSEAPAKERSATVYWLILAVLFVGASVLRRFPFDDNEARHVIWEFISTTLALVVGSLALVRFYSKKQETFLFIGTGFLGTGLLNGYHAVMTSALITGGMTGLEAADRAAWTWTASRLFLSMFLFGSVFLWSDDSESQRSHVNELAVYVMAAVLTTAFFLVFTFFPLPPAYYPEYLVWRPAEFLPATFFFAAWVGYLRRGEWRTEPFQYWLLISLMVSVFLHGMYMAYATSEFDGIADAAHLLKIGSNVCVLAGLMISVFVTFRSEASALETVRQTNLAMAREVEVRAEAEHRLRDFLDNANDLIQITDSEGSLAYVNRAWTATFGFEEKAVTGNSMYSLLRPSNQVELETAFRKLAEGGSMERFISEFHTADGDPVICAISANCSRVDGEVVAVRSIIRNVTDTVIAERELAGSRANLNALVESTGDVIWSVNSDHALITFNAAYALAVEARTGREPSVGDGPEQLYPSDQAIWFQQAYDEVMRTGRQTKIRSEEMDGELRHLELFFSPIRDQEDSAGVVVFGKDITRRRRAEVDLVSAKNEAEAANRAKSHFLANMSQELRTPLNSVIGFANILLKNKKKNLKSSDLGFLDRIQVNGKHLLGLINEILDLAKIESGRMELDLMMVDVANLAHEALALVEGQVRSREAEVKVWVEAPDAAEEIETDPAKLKQVIVNLVGNALKFTESGEIAVRLEVDEATGKPTSLSVIDTGIGIPEERLGAIFEAFQQAEAGTARQFGGTGLGLAISRSMCLLMGYDLTVESVVGQGTTFKILFPEFGGAASRAQVALAAAQKVSRGPDGDAVAPVVTVGSVAGDDEVHAPARSERRTAAYSGTTGPKAARGEVKRFKVLVIDDDPDSLVLMEDYLADFGCEVLQAASGRVGLEMARTHRPDLVTLDLHMPDIDGWEVLRTLKAEPEISHIPVVIASVAANEGRGRLFGAVDLLTKPIERADLLRVLWRQLVNQHGRRVLLVDDDPEVQALLTQGLAVDDLELHCVSNGEEALLFLERDTPPAVLLDLRMPVMDGFEFLDRMRKSRYHKGLPVIAITVKRLTPKEEQKLADKASAIVIKDENFVPRVRAILATLFPVESRMTKAEPTAD
jgi:PAS domain S-box-containing protein